MATETTMFDKIINRIGRNSQEHRELRDDYAEFRSSVKAGLGDAGPTEEEADSTGALLDGIAALRIMADTGASAVARVVELETEQALIAEKLGLVEDEEAADGAE